MTVISTAACSRLWGVGGWLAIPVTNFLEGGDGPVRGGGYQCSWNNEGKRLPRGKPLAELAKNKKRHKPQDLAIPLLEISAGTSYLPDSFKCVIYIYIYFFFIE